MECELNELRDQDLLLKIAGEDPAQAESAVAELIMRHRRVVYGSALRACGGNVHLAEEAFQETFIRFVSWLARGRHALGPDLVPLLVLFAKRTALDIMRQEYRHVPTASEEEVSAIEEPSFDEDPALLPRLLDVLDPRSRMIIELSFMQGLSAVEIGDKLDLTAANVRVIRHRAIQAMRLESQRREKSERDL